MQAPAPGSASAVARRRRLARDLGGRVLLGGRFSEDSRKIRGSGGVWRGAGGVRARTTCAPCEATACAVRMEATGCAMRYRAAASSMQHRRQRRRQEAAGRQRAGCGGCGVPRGGAVRRVYCGTLRHIKAHGRGEKWKREGRSGCKKQEDAQEEVTISTADRKPNTRDTRGRHSRHTYTYIIQAQARHSERHAPTCSEVLSTRRYL
jgi:hypothetical protein